MFPHLDLSDYLNRHKNRDVEATVDYILKNSNMFKEKRKVYLANNNNPNKHKYYIKKFANFLIINN